MTAYPAEFIPVGPRSAKVMCTICGRKGYDARDPWAAACRQGHPFTCPDCGRRSADRWGAAQHARRHAHARPPTEAE